MSQKKQKRLDAKKILIQSNLKEEGQVTKTLKLASYDKSERQALIRKIPDSDDAKIAAAIEIQRVFRGFCTRCRLLKLTDPSASATALYGNSKHHLSRLHDFSPSPEKITSARTKSRARQLLEAKYRQYVQNMLDRGVPRNSSHIWTFEDFCAGELQTWWKIKINDIQSKQHKVKVGSSSSITKKRRDTPLTTVGAASIIQRAWRRHIDVQVYRYYRDLINFKQRGDPALMLRCINPTEAKMLDAASGIHVKFRLAGDKFPPNIYYKIFTHRPVQDLCANSPKDYTKPDAKRLMARDVHNKGNRVPYGDNSGWYERAENNGYRLVSDRLLHHVMSDPVTWETSHKKISFHHNKLQRKQDVEKKKKTKKIDWMKKMYRQGMLHAKSTDTETIDLIEGAAAGMVATVDVHGPDAVQDWEVDELLDWTTSLNYDEYLNGWQEIATSNVSEKAVIDRIKLNTQASSDPFEVRVRQGRDVSTKPSFNTPESPLSMTSANYNRH